MIHATAQGRVLVTGDIDFLSLATVTPDHAGIVFIDRHRLSIGQQVRGLILIFEVLAPDDLRGGVEYLRAT